MMPSNSRRCLRRFCVATLWLAPIQMAVGAPPAAPPLPKQYDVSVRYQIDTAPVDRLGQYAEMTRYFRALGFVVDPSQDDDPRDVDETRFHGTIPSANARLLLNEPHVQSLLLLPAGYQTPEEENTPVKVQLELASGVPSDRQRVFADQVRAKLVSLSFQEAVGYDHRGHTRLAGAIPAGNLELLLKDIRWQPSGWLAPATPVT
jgi:hypothetical protein